MKIDLNELQELFLDADAINHNEKIMSSVDIKTAFGLLTRAFKNYEHVKEHTSLNILEQANEIVYKRSEEKEREYGSFTESMSKTAEIASILCNKEFTTEDSFKFAMALKLSRISNKVKRDSTMDLCAYTAGLQNYKDE